MIIRFARAFGATTPLPEDMIEYLYSKPDGPSKFALILSDKARQFVSIDRYERRALSRRKFAIRSMKSCRNSKRPSSSTKTARWTGGTATEAAVEERVMGVARD
jgi:hypothetical protein